jgi:hypothetical protein
MQEWHSTCALEDARKYRIATTGARRAKGTRREGSALPLHQFCCRTVMFPTNNELLPVSVLKSTANVGSAECVLCAWCQRLK